MEIGVKKNWSGRQDGARAVVALGPFPGHTRFD